MLVMELLEPGVIDQVKADPQSVLHKLAKKVTRNLPTPAFVSDATTYRIVVIALGLVAVIATGGAIYLSSMATSPRVDIPDVVTALGSAAIGALAGLLAPSPRST